LDLLLSGATAPEARNDHPGDYRNRLLGGRFAWSLGDSFRAAFGVAGLPDRDRPERIRTIAIRER
jgi:hypothetical protein